MRTDRQAETLSVCTCSPLAGRADGTWSVRARAWNAIVLLQGRDIARSLARPPHLDV